MSIATERPIFTLLNRYSESHQHPTNKTIHWICVPVIVFSLLGMLWAISPYLVYGFMALALIYYIWLSITLAIGMALFSLLAIGLLMTIPYLLWVSIGLFVAAWVGQFIGHQIEGKKPSFLEDVQFLLIGPVWLLSFIYRRLGISY